MRSGSRWSRSRAYSAMSPRSTRSPVESTPSGRGASLLRWATAAARYSAVRYTVSFRLSGVLRWRSLICAMSMQRRLRRLRLEPAPHLVDLRGKRHAAAIGHRRLLGETGVELDEDRA